MRPNLRRPAAIVGLSFLLGVLPFIISLPVARYGWVSGIPSFWNDVGLVLVPCGIMLVAWAVRVHHAHGSDGRSSDMVPTYLLIRGPYHYTRNPMYLGYLLIWLAWSIFYGSISVLVAFLVLYAVFQFIVVPHEERTLDNKFGDEYRRYKKQVPRWFRLRK